MIFFFKHKIFINLFLFNILFVCFFKLFELGVDGGENEGDGELLAETDEIPFECGARSVSAMREIFFNKHSFRRHCFLVVYNGDDQ